MFSQILTSCRLKPSKNYKSWQRFFKILDFKDIKFQVKVRDLHKIEKEKKEFHWDFVICVFGYEIKEKRPICVSKDAVNKNVDLFLIGKKGKRCYVLIKDFNTFMYDHTLYHGRKQFCYCLHALSTKEILKHLKKY